MRTLTIEEIEKLSSRKGVRKTAVENFLSKFQPNVIEAIEI